MSREQVYGRRPVREALRGQREVLELWATERAIKSESWLRELERPRVAVLGDDADLEGGFVEAERGEVLDVNRFEAFAAQVRKIVGEVVDLLARDFGV